MHDILAIVFLLQLFVFISSSTPNTHTPNGSQMHLGLSLGLKLSHIGGLVGGDLGLAFFIRQFLGVPPLLNWSRLLGDLLRGRIVANGLMGLLVDILNLPTNKLNMLKIGHSIIEYISILFYI